MTSAAPLESAFLAPARCRLRIPYSRFPLSPAMPKGVLLDPRRAVPRLTRLKASSAAGVPELVVDGVHDRGTDRVSGPERLSGRSRRAARASRRTRFRSVPARGSSGRARTRPWWSRVRSTVLVSSLGPRAPSSTGLVATWCQTCSSIPNAVAPVNRVRSAATASSSGLIQRHTVCQVVPSCRARPAAEACSRRGWPMAHQHARVVNSAR